MLACMGVPSKVEMVFEQQPVWQINHAKVGDLVGWAALKGGGRLPFIEASKGIGLIRTGDVLGVDRNQHHASLRHGWWKVLSFLT